MTKIIDRKQTKANIIPVTLAGQNLVLQDLQELHLHVAIVLS